MAAFFTSEWLADLVLFVLFVEALVLIWRHRRRDDFRARALTIMIALAPGACLVLALRAALTDAHWIWPALWLALSFPFHLADLARRKP